MNPPAHTESQKRAPPSASDPRAMGPTRMPMGTLRQRVVFLLISVVVFTGLWKQSLYLQHSPSTPSVITRPPQDSYPGIDLSSPRAPFISWPLARICAETTFVPGLVFICDNNSGGPGNIRNYILTCVRYAIEAGATALLVPRIRTRSVEDLSNIFREYEDLDYMFDGQHFRSALGASCPQITLYRALEDVPHVTEKVRRERLPDIEKMVEQIAPKDYGSRRGCDKRDQNRHTDRFGAEFRSWLNESAVERGLEEIGVESPRLIRLKWGVLWDWDVLRDGPEFVASYGGLLKFTGEVLDLGQQIVQVLRKEASDIRTEDGRNSQRFLGVHLRTENDALDRWPSFEAQSTGYIKEASIQGFREGVAYLASGNETEAHKFANKAQSGLQLKIRTKYKLLNGDNLEKLKSLSWDQQALVDFVVLLESDYFIGVSPSSFSINVALKRHLRTGGLHTRPWKVGSVGDGRSWIVGQHKDYWDDWLFMYDGMWP